MKTSRKTITVLMLVFGLALLGGAVPIARAGTLIVDNTIACDDVSGSPAYCTIQAAINAASAGDTINVAAGTYNENILVNKALSLVGADRAVTIIDGNNAGNTVTITASDVSLSGFTVTGGYSGGGNIWDPYGAVVVDGNGGASALTNVTLNDNIIDGNSGNGVYVSAAGHGGPADNIAITNCTISNNGSDASFFGGISLTYGWFDGGGTCDLGPGEAYDEWRRPKNVLIEGNDIVNAPTTGYVYGVYVNAGQNNTLRSNEIHGFSAKGLLIAASMPCTAIPCEDTTVQNNAIYDNAQNGVKLVSWNHHNTFVGNEIYNNGHGYTGAKDVRRYGFNFKDGDHNTLENNVIYGNKLGGLYLWGNGDPSYTWYSTHDNTITGNTISEHVAPNAHGIYIPARSGYPNGGFLNSTIACNNITNNTYGLESADATQTVIAEYNWWGDANGPTHASNPGGSGDAVSDGVDFDPWMAVPVDGVCPPPADDEGPITSNVVATPNPAPVGTAIDLTANVDDSTTGGSNIASAEYSLDGGITWYPMAAQDGDFDAVSEDVTATFNPPAETGIYTYNLCIRGTDSAGNTGPNECIELMLVVYDPEGGFVTGGGWIDSPPGAYMPGPSGIVVVTEENVGVNWFTNDTRYNGYVAFVEGPGTPPLGIGSLEMGTTASADKAQLFNYDHIDMALADIEAISYATYRNSASTNPPAQYPALNIEVDYVGDGSSYTTLVWEPIYAYGQSKLAVDTWQTWDTMAPSQTSFGGGWWSTKDIPGVCAFNCFVDWGTIVQNNPNAKIKYGFGVNVGSGWDGNFTGAVDALTLSVSGGTVTYDFEPVAPFDPTGKATFGFVSKYKKGAQTPEGNTEFVFKAADLNFHSSSYDWLVVAGSRAKFKGTGTINGEGEYKFMLTALDADLQENDGFDVDRFRIKIWYEVDDTEFVVYDNGLGADEDDDNATTEIGGGSIVIHTKKK